MTVDIFLPQLASLLPARLGDLLDLTPDTWFVIAVAVILWVYMVVAPGGEPVDA